MQLTRAADLLVEGARHFKEELLLANGIGAKEEERAHLIEGLRPHSIQHKAQNLHQLLREEEEEEEEEEKEGYNHLPATQPIAKLC